MLKNIAWMNVYILGKCWLKEPTYIQKIFLVIPRIKNQISSMYLNKYSFVLNIYLMLAREGYAFFTFFGQTSIKKKVSISNKFSWISSASKKKSRILWVICKHFLGSHLGCFLFVNYSHFLILFFWNSQKVISRKLRRVGGFQIVNKIHLKMTSSNKQGKSPPPQALCKNRLYRDAHGKRSTSGQSETFLHRIVSFWDKNRLIGYFCRVSIEVFENFKFEVAQLHFEVLQLHFKNRIFIFMNSRYACKFLV